MIPLEVVVVDDCSTDQTFEVVLAVNDARVSCHSTGKNSGVAAARNIGIKLAKYDWVAFNDQDDIWCPGRLVKQLAVLAKLADAIGVAGGAARMAADGSSIWTGRFFGFQWTPVLSLKLSHPPYYNPLTDGASYLQTLIVSRDVTLRSGGFNEGLPLADDLDFAMRIGRLGRFGWVPEPMFLYRLGYHNQTAPSVAKAKTFIAAQAFVHAANAARKAGSAELDVVDFMRNYEPSSKQYAEFKIRQSIRYINTIWVYEGLLQAAWVGMKIFAGSPWLFLQQLYERVRYWTLLGR